MTKRMKILLSCGLVITALAIVGPMVGIAGSIKAQEEMQIETIVQEQGEESVESQELTEEEQVEESVESQELAEEEQVEEKQETDEIQEQQGEESVVAEDGSQEEEIEIQIEETAQTEEDKKMEKKLARLEKLREVELESKEILTKEEEKELSNLPVKIQGIELECGLYDYKADIYVVLNTTEVCIKDMQRDLDTMELSEELVANIHDRINHLTPVYEKYKLIMEQAEQDPNTDYEAISKALYADMHAVWDIINQ